MKRLILSALSAFALLAGLAASLAWGQQYAQPGKFDFYLFTLSWSPQFCATARRDTSECNVPNGNFVVHGLWPEFQNGSWPSNCSQEPGPADPAKEADVMAGPNLLRHEWEKHGTCSGLGVDGYFNMIRTVRKSITIPDAFLKLNQTQWLAPSDIKASFITANPQLKPEGMRIGCANNTLVEVKMCVSREGKPTDCGTIRDCRASTIKVLPTLQ